MDLPEKKDVARFLLSGDSVFVHLDPRAEGVSVPVWLKNSPQLVLQVGLNMPVAIPDLRFDDEGMVATLSFQRSPYYCQVPWTAVFALSNGEGKAMVWPESLPEELRGEIDREMGTAPPKGLRVVSDEPTPAEISHVDGPILIAGAAKQPSSTSRKSRPSHLKLVK